MNRRAFIRRAGALSALTAVGGSFWDRALSAPAAAGPSPYGELLPPDANGLMLPPGFTSRVVANSLLPVGDTGHVWHAFPDGGACVPTEDGGWIYVSNSEVPVAVPAPAIDLLDAAGLPLFGGVGAIRFAADGSIVDAYSILTGTSTNCAGGLTPWGTWLSCEEWEATDLLGVYSAGSVFECDPFGVAEAVVRPALGRFKHEMAGVDPVRHQVYLTEDVPDGLVYRYTPPARMWGSGAALEGGVLEAMQVGPTGATTWLPVPNPGAPTSALRSQVAGATRFAGGEGCIYDSDRIYISTKGDDRVWVHDVVAQTMTVLYASSDEIAPVLTGVDNLAVTAAHDIYVAEDGGDLEVCIITPDLVTASVVRMTGPQHGVESEAPYPTYSEVTGLAFSPDGNRLYFNSERGSGLPVPLPALGLGITYEVTGPFRGGTLAAAAAPVAAPPVPGRTPLVLGSTTEIPATGATSLLPAAAAAATAGAALLHLRRRADPS